MNYYHESITQKSWEELVRLKKLIDFVLIGGWAVYFYSQALKSKDIDIVVNYDQLPTLGKNYHLTKNERLCKYEAVKEEIQIDIYLPHFSRLGIPAEDILLNVSSVEGFTLVNIDLLFALKLFTLNERGRSPKGRKDFLDLLSLFISGRCDFFAIKDSIKKFQLERSCGFFKILLNENIQAAELNINKHHFSKIKKEMLNQLF